LISHRAHDVANKDGAIEQTSLYRLPLTFGINMTLGDFVSFQPTFLTNRQALPGYCVVSIQDFTV